MLNPLFNSLTCYTSGHFAHWSHGVRKKNHTTRETSALIICSTIDYEFISSVPYFRILNIPVRFTSFPLLFTCFIISLIFLNLLHKLSKQYISLKKMAGIGARKRLETFITSISL